MLESKTDTDSTEFDLVSHVAQALGQRFRVVLEVQRRDEDLGHLHDRGVRAGTASQAALDQPETLKEGTMKRLAYRVSELPELLGISRNKVYELIKDGTIRSIKAGKSRLVPVSAIDAFLSGE